MRNSRDENQYITRYTVFHRNVTREDKQTRPAGERREWNEWREPQARTKKDPIRRRLAAQ